MLGTLERYIEEVEARPGHSALDRVGHAATVAQTLSEVADQLVDHFVQAARGAGHSWSEIGEALGVSKQAAQQRFVSPSDDVLPFTDRARQVLSVAQAQATDLGHGYLGTEHLLLAMLVEDGSIAGKALTSAGIDYGDVKARVVEAVGAAGASGRGMTPRARGLLKRSFREAKADGRNEIAPEHMLQALIHDERSLATQILQELGAPPDELREAIQRLLEHHGQSLS